MEDTLSAPSHANDRAWLARLLADGARGAIALERLGSLPDGRLTYQPKRPLPNGRTELVLQPMELLRKLDTLVPTAAAELGPPTAHSRLTSCKTTTGEDAAPWRA
jgi:hypothetical protein